MEHIGCAVTGCMSKVHAKGLCNLHYRRMLNRGTTEQSEHGTRSNHPLYETWRHMTRYYKHPVCKEWQDFRTFISQVSERPSSKHFLKPLDAKTPISKDNFSWKERLCTSKSTDNEKLNRKEYMRMYRALNKDKCKDLDLKKQYGISLKYYNNLLLSQKYVCAICGNPEKDLNPKTKQPRNLAVDHCHSTGKIRGLLCGNCNKGIGKFKDDVTLLEKAIKYLKDHE